MKAGDLLVLKKNDPDRGKKPLLIVLKIKKHPNNASMDRVCLQWMSRNGGKSLSGELSRLIVENRYEIV